MKLFALAIISIALMFITGLWNPAPAHAAVNYTFSYNFANRYNTQQITYSFTNLIATQTYQWSVFTVDPLTGGGLQNFGNFVSTPDDRTGTPTAELFTFGGVDFSTPLGTITYPQGYVGPIAVMDSNGTILGRHFIAELPTFTTSPDSQWFDGGAGNTALGERQAIGSGRFQGSCRNPVYNQFNADGWLHSFTPCSVTTVQNGYAILHYQVTDVYDPSIDDDSIIFYRVPTSSVELSISVNELIDFQQTAAYSPGSFFNSFIIVNTNGRLLPFLDNTRCAQSFSGTGNPCIEGINPGIFNYSRYTVTPTWVSDGESVWIVTSDPTLAEWGISSSDEVSESGRQVVTITSSTQAVWDSYHGSQVLTDSVQGVIDNLIYTFALSRNYPYTVSSIASTPTITWEVAASSINSGLATVGEMSFILSDTYTIVPVTFPTFDESLNEVLENTGLDTDAGRAAVLTMLLFVGMLGVAAFSGLRNNLFAYLVVWTGLGATFMLGQFGTQLVNTVFVIMTIGMWIFALLAARTGENSDA